MKDAKNETLLVHTACLLTIALSFTLALTVLKPYPVPATILLGGALWLWGKLGFKPANPVLARILQQLEPAAVAALSQRPPSPPIEPLRTVSDVVRESMSTGKTVFGSDVIDDVGLGGDVREPGTVVKDRQSKLIGIVDDNGKLVPSATPITHPPTEDETPVVAPAKEPPK